MQPSEAILIAILVVLVLVVVYQGYQASKGKNKSGFTPSIPASTCSGGEDAPDPAQKQIPSGAQQSLADAQREAWYQMTANGGNGDFDPSKGGSPGAELEQFHKPAPGINYQDALIDSVADGRMRAQQKNWYSEVGPKSQTSMAVDTMDEAATMSAVPRQGITAFRFNAPTQNNPLFVTDQDKSQYARQATNFFIG